MRAAPFLLVPALFAVTLVPASASPETGPHLLQRPALSRTLIAFAYAGDLWTVPREGGRATRLTNGVGNESDPVFSPDGSSIAFTGEYDGNTDVFVVAASGGVPKRLTWHPAPDFAVGWKPDSRHVIFRSNRESASPRYTKLFEVSIEGGLPHPLPLPMAFAGQFSPDGNRFVYTPIGGASPFNYGTYVAWRNYRGGLASSVWIADLQTLRRTAVPRERSNDFSPMWVGDVVYFLSDRDGTTSLFRYKPGENTVTACFRNTGIDIRSASAGPGGIVFDQFGELHVFDIATGKQSRVPVDIVADMPEVRPHFVDVSREIKQSHISPTGVRALFEAHGEILTVGAEHGGVRNLTNTPGVMERQPAWSPDGQQIAYFSDEGGRYSLHIRAQSGEGEPKKFPLAEDATYYFNPEWSPDSKHLAFHDNKLGLWVLNTVDKKVTKVSEDYIYEQDRDTAWSPDSKWLAYTRALPNRLHGLFLYSVTTGQSTAATEGASDVASPAFDRDGQYLYFTSSTNYGPTTSGLDMSSDEHQVTRSIYALVLAADGKSPVTPESDEEKTPDAPAQIAKLTGDGADNPKDSANEKGSKSPKPPKPVKVDLNGIADRVVALPIPPSKYGQLAAGKSGSLYLLEQASPASAGAGWTLQKYDAKTRKVDRLADHVNGFDLSFDGEKMLIELAHQDSGGAQLARPPAPSFFIVSASAAVKPGEGAVSLADMEVRVDPMAEWRQMYHEVWQIERSYFYDPHFHGVDTFSAEEKFRPYLESLSARADLNYLFQEMLSGFSVGHLRGSGGTIPSATKVKGGLLGADFSIAGGRYRIDHIYTGEHWNPDVKAPLATPGLKVAEGNYILAVDGQNLSGSDDISRLLESTAGRSITLRIASDAKGSAAHDISVVPVQDENNLRLLAWMEHNRRKVDELSGGKLAYVYLPDTGERGLTNFNRYYFAQLDKQGVVIDERFNGGGQAADYMIDVMRRQLMSYWSPRYGAIYKTPAASIQGPKVMLTNEFSGSGGDALPWYFRQANLGPLVGKRTWGGLVGISAYPTLMDGGQVTSPNFGFFSPSGQWDVENNGVAPDFEVELDPKEMNDGKDAQLEKAVELAMAELAKHPVTLPARPAFPNYNISRGSEQAKPKSGGH